MFSVMARDLQKEVAGEAQQSFAVVKHQYERDRSCHRSRCYCTGTMAPPKSHLSPQDQSLEALDRWPSSSQMFWTFPGGGNLQDADGGVLVAIRKPQRTDLLGKPEF